MKEPRFEQLIVDGSDDIVYLADAQNYELIFLNETGRKALGLSRGSSLRGLKCYNVIQEKDSPCAFCTNRFLSYDSTYTWEHYNERLGRTYLLRDKLMDVGGRPARMEIATDVTAFKTSPGPGSPESLNDVFLQCVGKLRAEKDVDDAINSLLDYLGNFYRADRTYVFEFDLALQLTHNTYEWCKEGVAPMIDELQNIPLSAVDRWIEAFKARGYIMIPSLRSLPPDSLEYQILEPQGVGSLIAAPFFDGEQSIIGFIGVDNPTANMELPRLLESLSPFLKEYLEKRSMLQKIEHLSEEDALTRLQNRDSFYKRLSRLKDGQPAPVGIAYLDLNGLQLANETYGNDYGDSLILRTADHLRSVFECDIYRIGSDEFIALCSGIERDSFEDMVARLHHKIEEDELCSVAIGARWDDGKGSVSDVMAEAVRLMYINKNTFYHNSPGALPRHRTHFAQELVDDIRAGAYVVLLQPKVYLKDHMIRGAEALIRRREKDGSLRPPVEFISRLEAEGTIRYVDFFVLETVCNVLSQWRSAGQPQSRISVNFSRDTLMEEHVVEEMLDVCRKYGVDPRWITIEVTESIGQMDMKYMKKLILDVKEAGFSISLDDFGTQYSNLAILSAIDFDELKFDKTLVNDIVTNRKSESIMRYAVVLGKSLNETASVAEGIETAEQLELLEGMDCDYGQGYLFSRPIPISEFEALLERNQPIGVH